MPRGKKTTPEVIYKIMAVWAVNKNYKETAENLKLPVSTVKKIVEEHKDEEKFVKLCNEKEDKFAKKATVAIDLAFKRLTEVLLDDTNNIPVNHLTTVIGTLFDKRALINGEATANTVVEIKLPKECEEYAK